MLRLIESYSDSTVAVEGQTLPSLCTVEDADGLRWFITESNRFPIHLWVKAATSGVAALVQPNLMVCTTEAFMDHRTTEGHEFVVGGWVQFPAFPTARTLVAAQDAPEPPAKGFVHLHLHTEYSSFDGLSKVEEAVLEAKGHGQEAVAITDHGIVAGHPDLAKYAGKHGLKPIFGMEGYLADDRWAREDQWDYFHVILLAQNQVGLHNLWAASTEAYRDGYYGKPRMDWDTLKRHSEGMVASTGCLSGPVSDAIKKGDEPLARQRLARMLDIFGDRLYVEMHSNSIPEQIQVNHALVRLATEMGVPMLGVVDSHFMTPHDADAHRAWMACATKSDVDDDSEINGYSPELYVSSEADVRSQLAYLGQAVVDECITNTVVVANGCTATLGSKPVPPVFSKATTADPDPVQHDVDRLMDLCLTNWEARTKGKRESQEVYMARFEREMKLLISKGFCGYFLMVADQTQYAKDARILVGPGRGSGGGSLVAYLSKITEVDPVEADLLFERFMTEGRTALPDFDVDYPASKKKVMLDYTRSRWGEEYVATVGSHLRLKNKGIVKDLGSAMRDSLGTEAFVDLQKVAKIIEAAEASTAGLGMPWEDLWIQHEEDLAPFRRKYPDLFAMADRLVGRLKTYGKHAAGVVISTDEPLTGKYPLRQGEKDEGGQMVTQFEKDALEELLGLVKFDLLTLRTLDTIQMTVDLIREQMGIDINVYDWVEEYDDPQVWDEISAGHTLGIFQIETSAGTRLTKQMRPHNMAELADTITLVRPGPDRSGLKDTYLRRRDGEEPVSVPDPRLEPVLAKTYGCLLYQEDIMAATMVLAGYDGNEADAVRKVLGKKQVEKVAEAGQKFVRQAVERGMEKDAADMLWAQMAEFAKYSFNRAHAFAYAVLGYWTAWLKFHYPVQFLTSALSTVKADRIPDFIGEARRMGYAVLPPDINLSKVGFTGTALAVRYGLDALKGIGVPTVEEIVAQQPFTSFEDFMTRCVEPKGSKVNRGHVATLARIGAFDSLGVNRRALEARLADDKSGANEVCRFKTDLALIPSPYRNTENPEKVGQTLPCTFDWANEPVQYGRPTISKKTGLEVPGKPLKTKPLPLKCSKACRQYAQVDAPVYEVVEPYTDEDIRQIEHEMLGIFLSTTPFDRLHADDRELCRDQADLLMDLNSGNGTFMIAGILTKVREHIPASGKVMCFTAFETEVGTFDVVVFSDNYEKYKVDLTKGTLAYAEVTRNSRGINLYSYMPVK